MREKSRDDNSDTSDAPEKRRDWLTPGQLTIRFKGHHDSFVKELHLLRRGMIAALIAVGFVDEQATEYIDSKFVGYRNVPARGPTTSPRAIVIAASPKAIAILGPEKKERIDELLPRKDSSWRSAFELARDYRGDVPRLNNRLKKFREQLIHDVEDSDCVGLKPEEVVDNHLIGKRRSKGNVVLCASPDAVGAMEQTGSLVQRPPKPGQKSGHSRD